MHPTIMWFKTHRKDLAYSLNSLYSTLAISKQAVYQYHKRQDLFDQKLIQLLEEANDLRSEHPGCGVEKMYYTLRPDFLGRDRFIETMMSFGYRIKRQKNYKQTTLAGAIYYPNLIKGIEIDSPSKVWQSDITYIPIGLSHYYAVFLIDVYTKKIVGHQVSDHLRATANVKALKIALKSHKAPTIHHSDRGSQYTYKKYIALLKANNCQISMCQSAQDNAYAERINRTIKEEYLNHWKPKTFKELKLFCKKAVKQYNTIRPHKNLNNTSPIEFENLWPSLSDEQRPKVTIFNNECL